MQTNLGQSDCIRLFDKNGNHVLTIIQCYDDESMIDIGTPDGKVLYCADFSKLLENVLHLAEPIDFP